MDESTREQWDHIARGVGRRLGERPRPHARACSATLAGITNGFAVDQLTHVCQTAARAERAGADNEVVVAALCHDIAKAVSEPNHPAVAAALLKPYVRPEVVWMVRGPPGLPGPALLRVHGQGPRGPRSSTSATRPTTLAEQFADEWDQTSFDPEYDTPPLEHFEPLVREIFSVPQRS